MNDLGQIEDKSHKVVFNFPNYIFFCVIIVLTIFLPPIGILVGVCAFFGIRGDYKRAKEKFHQLQQARLQEQQKQWKSQENHRQEQESHKKAENEQRDQEEQARKESTERRQTMEFEFSKVLGLTGKFTFEEVQRKYRELVAKYHPDKVAHLGDELKTLAEEKTKQINEAYRYFEKRYRG